jgi:hypothetical protein
MRSVSSHFLNLSIVDPQGFGLERAERGRVEQERGRLEQERAEQERAEQDRVDQDILFRRLKPVETAIASDSNIGFLPPYPSIQISKPSELPPSNLSEQGYGLWGSQSGASHYQSSEVAPIALASFSCSFNACGSFPIELSQSASLEGRQRRSPGDDWLFPHAPSSWDSHPDDTSYRPPRKYLPATQHSLMLHSGEYFSGALTRVDGFMDTPPTAPNDAIPHFSTRDQSPGLQPRRSSVPGLGLLFPVHQEYTRSSFTSSQPLDMKPPTLSHSSLRNHPVPNSSPTTSDTCVHNNYHSVMLLIFEQIFRGPAWSFGEPRTWEQDRVGTWDERAHIRTWS